MKKGIFMLIALALTLTANAKVLKYTARQFGMKPGTQENLAPKMQKALLTISKAMKQGDRVVFSFERGRYNFYPEGSAERELYISNHDQVNPKHVAVSLDRMHNVTIEGNGADIICHGRMLPIAMTDCKDMTLHALHVDFQMPHIAQASIVSNDASGITVKMAPWVNWRITREGMLECYEDAGRGAKWSLIPQAAIAFEKDTRHIVYRTSDIPLWPGGCTVNADSTISIRGWHQNQMKPGMVIAMRTYDRPAPAIFVGSCQNTTLTDVKVHYAEGMGLLAQMSTDITLDGFGVCLRHNNAEADDNPDPRYFTTQADATHFSGCRGQIISRNGLYEGMMDDAINVHGTYVKVLERINDHTLRCAYQHDQSWGFDWGYAGDTVQIIRSQTMEVVNADENENHYTLKGIRNLTDGTDNLFGQKEMVIEFDRDLPDEVSGNAGYGVENLSWTPSVVFSGNTIRNNRARGALFSTPRKVLCENNFFDHTSGTAILLCGDCNGWYETGACRDVTIRQNRFLDALTNMFQFTNAIISIYPEIPDLEHQQQYFHGGKPGAITIEDNTFETFDNPVLYAKSVDGLTFRNNRIIRNTDYPTFHWNKEKFLLEHTRRVDLGDEAENEYLNFLYRNMSLPDSTDYPRQYWQRQVDAALLAREQMPWADSVPEWEWRNFVLPVRVNNEGLDDARAVIYKELAPRISNMSMRDAALEVNHWCHEHVSYRPSDGRTSAPLSTMFNTIGRCGEESTFTVAALRAVGIPARQVYCPRWAHTDDNHAWVEVWVNDDDDDHWHFMGACEPEATLNKGWFNWAASRAMLVRAYDYGGNEINTLKTYAPTKTLTVRVVDGDSRPVSGATVDFRIYNYSEFYPLHTAMTDPDGNASFMTGYGDMLVWASLDGKAVARKVAKNETDVTLTLSDSGISYSTDDMLMHAPVSALPEPDRSIIDTVSANGRRLVEEDKIRTAYQQKAFSPTTSPLPEEGISYGKVLKDARSNWKVIRQFVDSSKDKDEALRVLGSLSEKDLRDVTLVVLKDAYDEEGKFCPRVSTEDLRPYRQFIRKRFTDILAIPDMNERAKAWLGWVSTNIHIDDSNNPKQRYTSVQGIYNTGRTSAASREIFAVAGARALGMKAELSAVGKAEVEMASLPQSLSPRGESGVNTPAAGVLRLKVDKKTQYYRGYSISRIVDGRPESLDYADDDQSVTGQFRKGVELPSGQYLLTVGTRLKGGDIISRIQVIDVPAGKTTTVKVNIPKAETSVKGDLQLQDSEKQACATSVQTAQ